jgi:hypothetical protein
MRLYFTKKFGVIRKEKAIGILDHTTEIVHKNVEKEWSQNGSLWHTR